MRSCALSAQKCKCLLSGGHFVERTGPPRHCLRGIITSEINIEVRLHRGDQVLVGANSGSNSRNTKIHRLSRLKMIDCIMKLCVFVEEMRFSLIFGSPPFAWSVSLGTP